jgi:hypothetical protein
VVQQKVCEVFVLKGKWQVSSISSGERESLITIVTGMNANGMYVSSLTIFPRQQIKVELPDEAPPGTIEAACHKSRWIQTEISTMLFKHFID